jgi:cytochrome c oxidase subunit 2
MMRALEFIIRQKEYLVVGLSIFLIAFAPLPRSNPAPKTVTIPIHAETFAFSPGIVEVNQGDHVVVEFSSIDVVHGLYIEDYDLSVTSDPGQTTELSFTADKPGTYRFRCSVTCGDLHPFMIGKLKVGNNELALRATGVALLFGILGLWSLRND